MPTTTAEKHDLNVLQQHLEAKTSRVFRARRIGMMRGRK